MKQATVSELVRSRNLKTCRKAHFQISSPIFTDTHPNEQGLCYLVLCSLLSLLPLFLVSYFFYLFHTFKCSWGCLLLPTQKEVNSSKVQSWGLFHILLNTLSYFLLLEPVNLEHNTPPHSYPHVMIESRLLYKDVSFSPLQHNAGNIPISDVL